MPIPQHKAGALLHPTALPSKKLDTDAFRWLDFMHKSGLSVWQVLPLGVPHNGLSPYDCQSAFAINPALFELAELKKKPVAENTLTQHTFFEQNAWWLEDFALYSVLKQSFSQKAWFQWPEEYRDRHPESMKKAQEHWQTELQEIKAAQYLYYTQWQAIRSYAAQLDIQLFGDIPMFVAHDSTDVWANRELFLLNKQGYPTQVTGVPPDYFSTTGQRWGNPHYDWDAMQKNHFLWWQQRINQHLEWFDFIRIDHFRGLEAAWMIPSECDTAIDGSWQKMPGDKMLQVLHDIYPTLPLVAEDLGIITPEVTALRQKFALPGMRILQFGFDGKLDNPHLSQNIQSDNIAYTGTHDNDTTLGWFNALHTEAQEYVLSTLPTASETSIPTKNKSITWLLIDATLASSARLAMIPLQDFLGLDSEHRMNTPGTVDNNWIWSFEWSSLDDDLSHNIHQHLESWQRL